MAPPKINRAFHKKTMSDSRQMPVKRACGLLCADSASTIGALQGGLTVVRKLTLVAICLACLSGTAMAQDAKAVIANAQKALGDVKSVSYSGSAKDVAFQQCGANSTGMNCRGTHDPMRPINNYVRVIDLTAPASRQTGATNNIGPG